MNTKVFVKKRLTSYLVLASAILICCGGCLNKPEPTYQANSPDSQFGHPTVTPKGLLRPDNPPSWTPSADFGGSYPTGLAEVGSDKQSVYHVGPADVLSVQVHQLTDLNRNSILKLEVDSLGRILVPMLNYVQVAGLTCDQVREELIFRLSQQLIRDPRVSVEILQHRSKPVLVFGAVSRTGPLYLTADALPLREVIGLARGIHLGSAGVIEITRRVRDQLPDDMTNTEDMAAALRWVTEQGEYEIVRVPVGAVLGNDRVRMNPLVYPNDVVHVPSAQDGYFYISGEVRSPGARVLRHPLNVMQAIVSAGDTTRIAAEGRCQVIRLTPDGEEQIIDVNLSKIREGEQDNFRLCRSDMIIVPTDPFKKFLDDVDKFVRRGVDAGVQVSYEATSTTTSASGGP